MTIEQSHGKARPTLPRSSDLPDLSGTVREPSANRDDRGRAAAGNDLASGRGWKRATKRLMGPVDVEDPELALVVQDARRLFSELIRELPSDGPSVRGLVALRARHQALAAFYGVKAMEAGLLTEEGMKFDERATQHGFRAERLAVTSHDIAAKSAGKKKNDDEPRPWLSKAAK